MPNITDDDRKAADLFVAYKLPAFSNNDISVKRAVSDDLAAAFTAYREKAVEPWRKAVLWLIKEADYLKRGGPDHDPNCKMCKAVAAARDLLEESHA